jgi:sulfur carrier protein ThiS
MTIDVALFAYLSAYQPDGQGGRQSRPLEVPEAATVADVIKQLALPDGPRVVFVNGRHAADEYRFSPGDRLAIFPPVAGG